MMRVYMDKRFELMDGRFEEQRSYVDDRFQQVDDRFQQVDDRFQQVDDRFQQVDDRFQQVDDRFQQVDDRFQQVEALMMNSKAASSWHDIVPIRVRNSLTEPPNFPNKVIKFWRLQRLRDQHRLVELLRFYGIRASDLTTPISDDEEEEESDSSLESQSTLEEAVGANPTFALARLAARLGLDYGSISHNMGLYEQVRTQQAAQRTERERPSEEDRKGTAKKAATSLDILPQRSKIPIEELMANPEAFPYESPPAQSYVGWAPRPKGDSLPSRTSASSSKKAGDSLPSQPSGRSTVPFTHTPSVAKGARKTTSMQTSSKHSQTSEETSF
jgi:hypothetical protein